MKEIKEYHSNQNLKRHYFTKNDGKIHGVYKVFFESGAILNETIVINGFVHGRTLIKKESREIDAISIGKNGRSNGIKINFYYKKYNYNV